MSKKLEKFSKEWYEAKKLGKQKIDDVLSKTSAKKKKVSKKK